MGMGLEPSTGPNPSGPIDGGRVNTGAPALHVAADTAVIGATDAVLTVSADLWRVEDSQRNS